MIARNGKQPRAMALVLILMAMGVVAMLALALLTAASSEAQTGANAAGAAKADAVAESGLEAVLYYLQYPQQAPLSWTGTSGYTLYANNVSISDPQGANYSVQAWPSGVPNQYSVQVTGVPSANSTLVRTISCVVQANHAIIPASAVFGSASSLPTGWSITNSLLGGLALQLNLNIGLTLSGGSIVQGSTQSLSAGATVYTVPTNTTVNYFGAGDTLQYTMPDGVTTGVPQQITGSTLTTAPSWNSHTNPGAVFYSLGTLSVSGSLSLNGTLVVRGGQLDVNGTLTVTPQSGMPAVITDSPIFMANQNVELDANGAVYAGAGVNWAANSSGTELNIKGSLLLPIGQNLSSTNSGQANISYFTSGNANTGLVPAYATSVSVLIWNSTTTYQQASQSGSGGGSSMGGGGIGF
jgi:hypothetical protein